MIAGIAKILEGEVIGPTTTVTVTTPVPEANADGDRRESCSHSSGTTSEYSGTSRNLLVGHRQTASLVSNRRIEVEDI